MAALFKFINFLFSQNPIQKDKLVQAFKDLDTVDKEFASGKFKNSEDKKTDSKNSKQSSATVNDLVLILGKAKSQIDNKDIVDILKREVRKKGENINLTITEYKVLMTLLKYPQKAFTREELISAALGEDYDGYDRVIDTHVKNLRQKIETSPKEPEYIITVHGTGYRLG